MTEDLLGPLAALALALVVLGLFYTGRILSRSTVPREDYDKVMEINASYAKVIPDLTAAVNKAVDVARAEQRRNGGS